MKILFRVLIVLVVLAVAAVAALLLSLNGIARRGIEGGATYALGVPTTVDSASIGLFSGEFGLAGLDVSNPPGYESPHFLRLEDAGVAVSLGSLRQETVELPRLALDGIDVHLQKNDAGTNYQVILDNLKKFEGSGEPADDAPAEEGGGKRFIVREFEVSNVTVHVDLLPGAGDVAKVTVPIESIMLTDVGTESDKGILLSELSGVLIKAILSAVAQVGGNLVAPESLEELRQQLSGLDGIAEYRMKAEADAAKYKAEYDRLREQADSLKKDVDTVKDAIKGIGDMFGGDKEDK